MSEPMTMEKWCKEVLEDCVIFGDLHRMVQGDD